MSDNTHQPSCRWERTTEYECEYRATHHYCPHPEHACTCPPAGGSPGAETPPLKPCPFCGEETTEESFVNENEGIGGENGGEMTPYYRVVCGECGAITEGARLERDAIAAWNRRAAPPSSVSQEGGKVDAGNDPLIFAERSLWHIANGHHGAVSTHARDAARHLRSLIASQSSALASLQQQLADAELTARYQSDVARQAVAAMEKAEQKLAKRHNDFDELYHVWEIEHCELLESRERESALQAENAGLRAVLAEIAAGSKDPDDWQPYDNFGEPEDTDLSNSGDCIDFGSRRTRWHIAKIARSALATPTPPQERP
jgi:Lar family restriction alleviation protein